MNNESPYIAGYKNLNVWNKGHDLVLEIYRATKVFPRDELFGLISQMRRCAVSIVANIVEGYGRRTTKDKLQFYYISRGSLNELEYYIDLSTELGYMSSDKGLKLREARAVVGKLLSGFVNAHNR